MTSAPPKSSRANHGVWLAGILLGLLGLIVAALVFFFNPTTHGFYPICQFHRLTGLNCPGCGMTRALYALLHGDIATALRDNALLVVTLPVLLARGLWLAVKKSRGQAITDFLPGKYLWALVFLTLAFGILRNLPGFAFLSPA